MNFSEASPGKLFELKHDREIREFGESLARFYATGEWMEGYGKIKDFVGGLGEKYGEEKLRSCYLYHVVIGSSPFADGGGNPFNIEIFDFDGGDSIAGFVAGFSLEKK